MRNLCIAIAAMFALGVTTPAFAQHHRGGGGGNWHGGGGGGFHHGGGGFGTGAAIGLGIIGLALGAAIANSGPEYAPAPAQSCYPQGCWIMGPSGWFWRPNY